MSLAGLDAGGEAQQQFAAAIIFNYASTDRGVIACPIPVGPHKPSSVG